MHEAEKAIPALVENTDAWMLIHTHISSIARPRIDIHVDRLLGTQFMMQCWCGSHGLREVSSKHENLVSLTVWLARHSTGRCGACMTVFCNMTS